MRRTHLVSLALAAVALSLMACGTNDMATPTATPTPGPSERFQTVRTLESYRFTVHVHADGDIVDQTEAPAGLSLSGEPILIDITGHWVSPNREYSMVTFEFGVLKATQETVRIGNHVWTRIEGGVWRERAPLTDAENLIGQNVPLTPDALFGRDEEGVLERLTADLEARPHTLKIVNGRETRHWTLDEKWFDAYLDEFLEVLSGIPRDQGLQLDIQLWSDVETGVGTGLEVIGSVPGHPHILHLELRLHDVNAPGLVVEPPVGAIAP